MDSLSETELTVARLGVRGDGIGEADSGAVRVARALPGEVVAGVAQDGRMPAPRILAPSSERVAAPCPHYGGCGGCSLQHATDGFVAAWKQDVVAVALAAHGLAAPLRPILTSPPRNRRRATLGGRRTKKGALVGFHAPRAMTLTAVPDCLILSDALRAVLPALEALTVAGASRSGEIAFTVTDTPQGVDVAAEGGKPPDAGLRARLAIAAVKARFARLTWNGELLAQRASPQIAMGRARVTPPPGAFLQATAEGEAALVAAVREAVGEAGRIADLFAGCGTFALPLADHAAVHAVEGEAALTEALMAGWRGAAGGHAVTAETRDLFRRPLLPDELSRFDAVVIDPPRAGAAAQAAELAACAVPRIAHVSCNPATFARDAAVLTAGGYRLDWVQVIDQFRWSAHVELAAAFRRA